jgi:hypothetical protein
MMKRWENWSYKTRARIAAAMFCLLAMASYTFSVRKTLEQYAVNKRLKTELSLARDVPSKLSGLDNQLKSMNLVLNSRQVESRDVRKRLVTVITAYCADHGLVFSELSEPIIEAKGEFRVQTSLIKLQGPFDDMLRLIYNLEQHERLGKAVSLHMFKKKNHRTKSEELFAHLYYQDVTTITSNTTNGNN